jgi:2',3'-cyclic-nucleotide 2'-phosphodiesterase (5'-nucleotidase family)
MLRPFASITVRRILHTFVLHHFNPRSDGSTRSCYLFLLLLLIASNLGGAAQIAFQIKEWRASSSDPVVALHDGDALTGTLFGLEPDAAYRSEVGFDAMVARNHEFDDGCDEELAKFAKLLKAPILLYNCKLQEMENECLQVLVWLILKIVLHDYEWLDF